METHTAVNAVKTERIDSEFDGRRNMGKLKNNIFDIHNIDARSIDNVITEKIVDVTITSPPYYDMKDYGHKKQIGYGQSYEKYLEDLNLVFKKVFNVTKDTGTLWVIINTFRTNNEIVPLPFDFSDTIKKCGWKLQEIIIWSKDRTVPWTHIGQMRHMFEYILVFSKVEKYNYYIDRIKDYVNLKKWWIKYPERYNPKGKTPAEIWNFDIPTQGSWGKGYIKHFCPLPEELVDRIIRLTTNEHDVVLDPFAGSGTVLAQAAFSKRQFIGFELNKNYIKMFKQYLRKHLSQKRRAYEISKKINLRQAEFETLVLNLRILKFARVLRKQLHADGYRVVKSILVERLNERPEENHKLVAARYSLLISKGISKKGLLNKIEQLVSKPPLSKYGIEADFVMTNELNTFLKRISNNVLYSYTAIATHSYSKVIKREDIVKAPPIISPIKVQLNEKDFS